MFFYENCAVDANNSPIFQLEMPRNLVADLFLSLYSFTGLFVGPWSPSQGLTFTTSKNLGHFCPGAQPGFRKGGRGSLIPKDNLYI